MEIIRLILMPFWKLWFVLVFVISFLLLYPFFWLALTFQKLEAAFTLKKVWAFIIAYGSGIIPDIRYSHKKYTLPKTCIIAPNHTSYLDICLSALYIKHLALYMGKAELLRVPLFGIFFRKMDIPVNRSSRMDSHKAFTAAGVALDKGQSMVIYPEGTISNNGHLRPFKNGAFKLAIEKQVPVVPVVNVNNWKLLQNGGFFKSFGRPGIATIIIHDPIPTKGMTEENLVDLREKVHRIIQKTLEEYNGSKN
ncbi:MAG: 1-acyl-sn-glycerol-3-phosphate acyltransferase [Bacteroidetes bacterium]|nr:1-acyl-sn-glycerol-3-phosphate acyltransferase [Bacteroidota bacterium]